MAPWNPLQFLQQKAAEAQRAIQSAPRVAGQIWQRQVNPNIQRAQRVVRQVSNAPVVRQVTEGYRRLPPAIRSGVNPLSSASPVGLRGAGLSLGTNLVTDAIVSELLIPRLPKEVGGPLNDFMVFTSNPFGGPAHRLAAYAVLRPTPVGAAEDQQMAQIRKEYEDKKRAAANRAPAQDLQLAAPAEPAFRLPPPAQTSYTETSAPAVQVSAPIAQPSPQPAPAASTSPRAAAAQVTAPSQPAEMLSPLAKEYAQQQRIAELLGAEEMVRRLNSARPMATVSDEDLLTWADANPALAYREMLRRESLAN